MHGIPAPWGNVVFIGGFQSGFCGRRQQHSTHEWALKLVSGASFLVQLALFFEPEPVPELPAPAVGPKKPEIGQKPGPGRRGRVCHRQRRQTSQGRPTPG